MKLKYLFYIFSSFVILLIFTSCKMEPESQYIFDKATFDAQKAKWERADLQNYSFEYSISPIIPNYVCGLVSVKDGVGTVKLILRGLDEGSDGYNHEINYLEELYGFTIRLDTINKVFDLIQTRARLEKKRFDSGELSYYSMKVNYDESYGFPTYADETTTIKGLEYEPGLIIEKPGELRLKLKNFKISN